MDPKCTKAWTQTRNPKHLWLLNMARYPRGPSGSPCTDGEEPTAQPEGPQKRSAPTAPTRRLGRKTPHNPWPNLLRPMPWAGREHPVPPISHDPLLCTGPVGWTFCEPLYEPLYKRLNLVTPERSVTSCRPKLPAERMFST